MTGERVPADGEEWVVGSADGGWRVPVRWAFSRRARLRGLRPRADEGGLVLRTRSIHTFGMATDLLVVALDASGSVLASEVVPPRRWRLHRGARWIVELPGRLPAPPTGSSLVLWRRILAR